MKILLLQIGKTNKDYLKKGVEEYANRIKKYISFDIYSIPDIKVSKKINVNIIKEKEGKEIITKLKSDDKVILLDERGKKYTSIDFSKYLINKMNQSTKRLVFIIGGAYGFSDKVYEIANEKLSLSEMTFSHQIIRLIFLEQLYRAFTIIKGEPYHNE